MLYLLAHCPAFACHHKNLVGTLPTDALPQFESNVYVAVECSNCGQVFRELTSRLEVWQSLASMSAGNDGRH